eukprot:192557-Prorocentrum_minimum.AAC.1
MMCPLGLTYAQSAALTRLLTYLLTLAPVVPKTGFQYRRQLQTLSQAVRYVKAQDLASDHREPSTAICGNLRSVHSRVAYLAGPEICSLSPCDWLPYQEYALFTPVICSHIRNMLSSPL